MSLSNTAVDISEDALTNDVLKLLLFDRTTRRNIIWATNDYENHGTEYKFAYPITIGCITGKNKEIIQPRITKQKMHQQNRTKQKAEVFTPAWVCNEQNNLIDSVWFERKGVFNTSENEKWETNHFKIVFEEKKGRRWTDYVDAKRLEITCGEAPYLTSRYDMATGTPIDVTDRIGLLDRKLRVVSENANTEDEWLQWTYRAFESIYGYEFQGDNLLLARENLLYTFIDNMQQKLDRRPVPQELKKAALIISWNIWQMDGLTSAVPFKRTERNTNDLNLEAAEELPGEPVYCKIRDWRSKETLLYKSLFN